MRRDVPVLAAVSAAKETGDTLSLVLFPRPGPPRSLTDLVSGCSASYNSFLRFNASPVQGARVGAVRSASDKLSPAPSLVQVDRA